MAGSPGRVANRCFPWRIPSEPPRERAELAEDAVERRIVAEALRIVHVLIARQPAVDGLPDQVGEWELRVLAPRIGDVLRDQVADAQALVQFAHEDEPAVGGDARALELDAEPGVKRELKGLVLCFTIGCGPPIRRHRAQTRTDQDVRLIATASVPSSHRKSGFPPLHYLTQSASKCKMSAGVPSRTFGGIISPFQTAGHLYLSSGSEEFILIVWKGCGRFWALRPITSPSRMKSFAGSARAASTISGTAAVTSFKLRE